MTMADVLIDLTVLTEHDIDLGHRLDLRRGDISIWLPENECYVLSILWRGGAWNTKDITAAVRADFWECSRGTVQSACKALLHRGLVAKKIVYTGNRGPAVDFFTAACTRKGLLHVLIGRTLQTMLAEFPVETRQSLKAIVTRRQEEHDNLG
jgi:predicted transcriptional regulator